MIDLADITLVLVLASGAAWLWHAHGLSEYALTLARQHCEKFDIALLDQNVAARGLRLQRDRKGRRRLVRVYDFEFTVTGEQRLKGRLVLAGRRLVSIELDPHPFQPSAAESRNVVHLAEWKRSHEDVTRH